MVKSVFCGCIPLSMKWIKEKISGDIRLNFEIEIKIKLHGVGCGDAEIFFSRNIKNYFKFQFFLQE